MKNVLNLGVAVLAAVAVSGCDEMFSAGLRAGPPTVPTVVDATTGQGETGQRPITRPAIAPKPAASAQTAEQFDTTTSAQRAEAVAAAPEGGGRKLGTTVGALGNPAEPGFWLKTPLVSVPAKGRVEYPANGKSVVVDLIPIDGPKTAGSRVSLAALRLLGAPLTGLPDLVVYGE